MITSIKQDAFAYGAKNQAAIVKLCAVVQDLKNCLTFLTQVLRSLTVAMLSKPRTISAPSLKVE